MIKFRILHLIVTLCAVKHVILIYNTPTEKPMYIETFCKGNTDVEAVYGQDLKSGYNVIIRTNLSATTEITIKLDSQGTIKLTNDKAKFISDLNLISNTFYVVLTEDVTDFKFLVKGRPPPFHPPYVLGLSINGLQKCDYPDRTFFDKHNVGVAKFWGANPNVCGRRRIYKPQVELIVHGSPAELGNWPWHAAISRRNKKDLQYICGGTLISKYLVLTAAHCATYQEVPVNPEILWVILGKHVLAGIQNTNQEREVHQVIVHENFRQKSLNNDIALLKLSAEAEFNNYVQPACIWSNDIYDKLRAYDVIGTVIGWGIDQSETLSPTLREATIPVVPEYTCIQYEPVFYSNIMMNKKKFCAGLSNGTSACNGDSGGGFFVFVEDDKDFSRGEANPGAWYIKGIVSSTIAKANANICDPQAYTVFTDIAKYRDWILKYMT